MSFAPFLWKAHAPFSITSGDGREPTTAPPGRMFLAGGAVASVAPDATAFAHGKALMLTTVDLDWTPDDNEASVARNEAWLSEFHEAMRPFTSDQSYQNFIDGAERDYLRAYYGANLERLVEIKRKYDPSNLFRFPQSIPLSL
jgi:FAD/FMN-containing dehydrogenase